MPKKKSREKLIFEVNNPSLGKIIYTEQTRRFHRDLHPEVDDPQFTKGVRETCSSHTEFLHSITQPFDVVILYKYIGEVNNPLNEKYHKKWIKVAIGTRRRPRKVLSAYLDDKQKEKAFWRKARLRKK